MPSRRSLLRSVADGADYGEPLLVIEADSPGLSLFTATFG